VLDSRVVNIIVDVLQVKTVKLALAINDKVGVVKRGCKCAVESVDFFLLVCLQIIVTSDVFNGCFENYFSAFGD
jgi:hypothetical protein